MTRNRRAGFTLVELMIALVIFVLVAASLYRVLNVSQKTAQTQTEKAAMQGSLRTGIQLAMAEIQELWTDENVASAITAMTSTSMSYEAMRGMGLSCAPLALNQVTLDANTWRGLSLPTAGQGLYVFDQGADETIVTDDVWHDRTIQSVAGGTCADGVTVAHVITLTADLPVGAIATIAVPGPARTHEPMQLGLVASGGRNWLGIATGGGGLTPLAGPLTGLSLEYKDKTGQTTGTPANVKSIILRLFGETDRMATKNIAGTPTLLQDTMVVRVQLRNGR